MKARLKNVSPGGCLGVVLISVVILMALFAPWLSPHDPTLLNLRTRELPPVWLEGGSLTYPLGTDQLGRDVMSRIIFGARVSVVVGVLGTIVALVIGLMMGSVAGFFGGRIDALISRLLDTFMAIPFIILALAVVGAIGPQKGSSAIVVLVIVLGISGWADFARIARAETLALKAVPFVEAARALGQSSLSILFKHILPNIAAPMIVLSALQVGTVIIAEASLSFVGLGVQSPTVTWGLMLAEGRNYVASSWWLATFPGLAITLTVVACVLLGDWLRDSLDPRQKR